MFVHIEVDFTPKIANNIILVTQELGRCLLIVRQAIAFTSHRTNS